MDDLKIYWKNISSVFLIVGLAGSGYATITHLQSLIEERRWNEFLQQEERRKKMDSELEACMHTYTPHEKIITLDDIKYNKECLIKYLNAIEKR
ncbi:MAG: hypothetical protein Q8R37_05060 [Nanoarchaeota archaeon]|nr:hypothetical protein [Nanoarchaeota archaeon]